MDYVFFDLHELNPYFYRYNYRMFDDIVSSSNNIPAFGQIWPR